MYLHSLKLKNFKGFRGESQEIIFHGPNGDPGSGLNILVGENNVGKSTLLQAICFLMNLTRHSQNPTSIGSDGAPVSEECAVIGEFADSSSEEMMRTLEAVISENKDKDTMKEALTASGHLRVRRSLNNFEKTGILAEKGGFHEKSSNPTSLDFVISRAIDLHPLWASVEVEHLASFRFNTLSQKLLGDIFKTAEKSLDYKQFCKAFNDCFSGQKSSFRKEIQTIENQVSDQFRCFFGDGTIRFGFPEPKLSTLIRTLTPMLDLGNALPLTEHGQGVQRMTALALLVAWASIHSNKTVGSRKPYIFLLDEPEICLHPRGQARLLEALLTISKFYQVIVTTHSPIFLHSPAVRTANLLLCRRDDSTASNVVVSQTQFESLFLHGPTWGEICWHAYKMPTVEFHDELYSYLQDRSGSATVAAADKLLRLSFDEMNEHHTPCMWTRKDNRGKDRRDKLTLSSCIRNSVHHPENKCMGAGFVEKNLEESINVMLRVIKHLRAKEEAQLAE
ncbi:AAA family ATPase [uncultured Sutterella sp.]|uniref:ATP-dependent nuclease n=1 Tax=uncultured Sutterella sp. TaxID=286133 RepID=UPI002629D2DA|nr:AAA family ATPase [uncultured Sutterella sp.]